MSTSGSKKVILRSKDGETFEVEEAVASESITIKNMIEVVSTKEDVLVIPLPNVDSKILAKVIEYCTNHAHAPNEDDLNNFDDELVKVDHNTLFDLVLAANYLHIKGLLDLTCKTVADMIKGKTPEEIRKTLSIVNDEEEEVRRENQWVFE